MKIGSLFSGAGMLDEGVRAVLGGEVAWHVEFDRAAGETLARNYPSVPNHGDVTATDWSAVEPVDVLTGGFPCQDVSLAGAGAGLKTGTRSGLWFEYLRAIDALRPGLVVIENVRGLLSAKTDSSRELVSVGPKGGRKVGYTDRALGRVLADLADLGYDAQWRGVRASDVGAPHQRLRVFILATDASSVGHERPWRARDRWTRSADGCPGLVADAAGERCGATRRDNRLRPAGLESGTATDANDDSARPGQFEIDQTVSRAEPAQRGHGTAPNAGSFGRDGQQGQLGGGRNPTVGQQASDHPRDGAIAWGRFESAIRRWERLTRPAPAPTETGPKGGQRLSPLFVEWMMGWPDGWVTGIPGISRNEQLKICGNGVVPQQASLALSEMIPNLAEEKAA